MMKQVTVSNGNGAKAVEIYRLKGFANAYVSDSKLVVAIQRRRARELQEIRKGNERLRGLLRDDDVCTCELGTYTWCPVHK